MLTSEGLMGREVSCTRTLPCPGASTCKRTPRVGIACDRALGMLAIAKSPSLR